MAPHPTDLENWCYTLSSMDVEYHYIFSSRCSTDNKRESFAYRAMIVESSDYVHQWK